MKLRKLIALAGLAVLLSACGAGPTDPRTMGDDDDDMMLTQPAAAAAGR